MRLEIRTKAQFDDALAKGLFAVATDVMISNCDFVTEVPAFDKATDVWLENLPQVSVVPAFDKAIYVWLENLPQLTDNHSKFQCR